MSTLFSNYFKSLEKVMQKEGLEPSWYHYHTDLNRARLPIPPFLRTKYILQYLIKNVNTFFKLL